MIRNVARIDWADATESVPAFLVILGVPLSYSIGDGLALGFMSYPIVKLLAGRSREVKPVMAVLGVILLAYFIFVRGRLG